MRLTLLLLTGLKCVTCLAAGSRRIQKVISTSTRNGSTRSFSFSVDSTKNSSKLDLHKLNLNLSNVIQSAFLPSGYPTTTPPGYLPYATWSWIQDLSTQLRSVLATQRVLEGVGVGREGASALSAISNFLIRDGCGMAATLLFTAVRGSQFRFDVKRWRLAADILVDMGITLEVAAPQFPSIFLVLICLGNVCKALCGVAAGACGGAINLHWAKGSDISDINAKFGAQHTMTGSLGLVFGWLFARSLARVDLWHVWTLYATLTVLHIYANMRCMRLVAFDHFNTQRLDIILDDVIAQTPTGVNVPLATPSSVAAREPLFFRPLPRHHHSIPIHFGISFNEFVEETGMTLDDAESLLSSSRESYYLAVRTHGHDHSVYVCLKASISPKDMIQAHVHARLLSQSLERGSRMAITEASRQIKTLWPVFERKCVESGWNLSKVDLRTRGYEIVVRR